MKIALIGASGMAGSAILDEALNRGHQVTALARNPARVPARAGVTVAALDVLDADAVRAAVTGHDAVISAYRANGAPEQFGADFTAATANLIAASRATGARLLVVGGAATLEAAPGLLVLDTPDFPEAWKDVARALAGSLQTLRATPDIDWTFLSPSAFFEPGPRTGNFRLGRDQLLVDANGDSRISNADYAVALIDELEKPQHSRQRFTVGY